LSQLCSVFFGTISPPALDYCILLYNKIFTPYINCDKSDSISPRKEESFRTIIKLKKHESNYESARNCNRRCITGLTFN